MPWSGARMSLTSPLWQQPSGNAARQHSWGNRQGMAAFGSCLVRSCRGAISSAVDAWGKRLPAHMQGRLQSGRSRRYITQNLREGQ